MVYWTSCLWDIDPPCLWYIEPHPYRISNPLPMIYYTPWLWYFYLYSWYIEKPVNGISNPLPTEYDHEHPPAYCILTPVVPIVDRTPMVLWPVTYGILNPLLTRFWNPLSITFLKLWIKGWENVIQYMIVSDLRHVCCVLRFPPQIKLAATT